MNARIAAEVVSGSPGTKHRCAICGHDDCDCYAQARHAGKIRRVGFHESCLVGASWLVSPLATTLGTFAVSALGAIAGAAIAETPPGRAVRQRLRLRDANPIAKDEGFIDAEFEVEEDDT